MQVIDALAPPRAARVLSCACHDGGATSVAALDGFQVATGGRHGSIMLHDIRMMGSGADALPLWSLPGVHSGAVGAITTFASAAPNQPILLASGGADGDIRLTHLDGSECCVMCSHTSDSHTKLRTGSGSGALAIVTGLADTGAGLLSCGGDGKVNELQFRAK